MIAEIVQQLSGGLLVRMLHTKDGAKIGVTCVMHGNNKVCLYVPSFGPNFVLVFLSTWHASTTTVVFPLKVTSQVIR
jgi:hypothetical protein